VLATTSYDPWGTPQGSLSGPFGFTGELHSAGQVYLRARWYAPGQGRFVSEDPFVGFPELPYSLHAYQYAYSNPVMWTDPSGMVAHNGVDPRIQPKTDIALTLLNAMPEETYNDVPSEEGLNIPICQMETGIDWEASWDEWKVKANRVIDVYRDNIAVGINSIEEVARDFVDGSLLPATKEAFRQAARTIDDPLLAGLYDSLGDMMTNHVISNLANAPIWLELNIARTMLLVQVRQQRDRVHLYWIMGRGDPPLPGREFFVKGYLWSQAYCDVFEGCVAVTPFYLR